MRLVFRMPSLSNTAALNWAAVMPLGYVDTFAGFVGSLLHPVVGPGLEFVYQAGSIGGFGASACVEE